MSANRLTAISNRWIDCSWQFIQLPPSLVSFVPELHETALITNDPPSFFPISMNALYDFAHFCFHLSSSRLFLFHRPNFFLSPSSKSVRELHEIVVGWFSSMNTPWPSPFSSLSLECAFSQLWLSTFNSPRFNLSGLLYVSFITLFLPGNYVHIFFLIQLVLRTIHKLPFPCP